MYTKSLLCKLADIFPAVFVSLFYYKTIGSFCLEVFDGEGYWSSLAQNKPTFSLLRQADVAQEQTPIDFSEMVF